MLQTAIDSEVEAFVEGHRGRRDEHGRRLVVKHGSRPTREILTGAGKKEPIAVLDGYRESEQSWSVLLLDLRQRGLQTARKIAVGDGALGFRVALRKAFPETHEQRCWVHKTANVLNKMPKSVQPNWRTTEGNREESRELLAPWPIERPRTWKAMVNRAQNEAEVKAIRKCVSKGQPYGSQGFITQSAVRLSLEHTLRSRGRPGNNESRIGVGRAG